MPEQVLAQLAQDLGNAYNALELDPFPNIAGKNIKMGDDIRMTISPVKMSVHMEPMPVNPESPRHEIQPAENPTRKTIGITAEADRLLQQAAVTTLQSSNLTEYADVDLLTERFVDILQRWAIEGLPGAQERVDTIQQELMQIWEAVQNWEVYIPLVGLLIEDVVGFQFGGVTFRTSKGIKPELMSVLEPIILSSKGSVDAKSASLDSVEGFVDYFEHLPAVAVVSHKGLQNSAIRMAQATVELLLNVLRCYLPLVTPQDRRMWFGTVGSVPQGKQMIVVLAEDKEGYSTTASRIGASQPFRVTDKVMAFLESSCAWEQANQLASMPFQERTPLQSSIIAGCQLLGAAVVTLDDALSVQLCLTAIEAFLATGKELSTFESRCRQVSQLLKSSMPAEQSTQYYSAIVELRDHLFHLGPTMFNPELRLVSERMASMIFIELCLRHEQFTTLAAYFEQQGQG